jgi:hypothetical protein
MSVTDELREYARTLYRTKPNHNQLTEIADRIDAEHEAMLADVRKHVYCNECLHRRKTWLGRKPTFTSDFFCAYIGGREVKPDDFCSRGERWEEHERD